jgi:prevent-host-death family protein
MKVVPLREAKASLSSYIQQSQKDRVLITKHGRPAALVMGVEGEDLEDLLTVENPVFWEMIEQRRTSRTLPLEEMRRRLRSTTRSRTAVRPPASERRKRKTAKARRAR